MVFRKLRELWGVPADEYMSSIGPQQILRSDWRGDARGREHHHGNTLDADGTVFRGEIGLVFLLLVRWEVHGEDDFPHRASLLPAHPREILFPHGAEPRHDAGALPGRA